MQSIKKYLFISVAVISILGLGLFIMNGDNSNNPSDSADFINKSQEQLEESISTAEESVLDSVLTIGNSDAEVTIVEYFDYKCPNCHNFHRTVKEELKDRYFDSNQISFELRTTPIIGPDSARAARGAYCAEEQNAFTAYHDAVMEYMWVNYYESGNFAAEFEDILTNDVLTQISNSINIDSAQLITCIESLRYNPALDRDLLAAAEDGVRGTPGFTIGNQSFVGTQPISVFEALIESQLQ